MIKMKSYLQRSSFIICIFPIIALIFSIIYTNTPYLTGILTELNNSLNDFPLSDLQYIQNCSEEKYTQNIYQIPESVEGCSCVNVKNYKYKQANKSIVFRGKCKKNHTLNGCTSINYYPEINLTKWHSNEFCSKKFINLFGYKDYFKNSVGIYEKCKNGYKKCGKLDNMGNYICLPENESCPINDIKVKDKIDDSLNNTYDVYEIGNKYLYFTNQSSYPAITKLRVAEGQLCAGKGYYHTDYPQFILDGNFQLYGCRFKISDNIFDETITKLDKMTKYELYNDNNVSMYSRYNYSCEYPYYILNAEMFLYPKRYIGFDKQCLKENNLDIDNKLFDDQTITNINKRLMRNRELHNVLIWISIAALDFYFMTCFFINIDEEDNYKNFYIWCGITLPFYLSMVIITIIGLIAMSGVKKYPLCNDNYSNSKLMIFNKKSRNMFLNTLALFILLNGQLLVTIILFLLKRRKILTNSNNITYSDSQIINSVNNLNTENPLISGSTHND